MGVQQNSTYKCELYCKYLDSLNMLGVLPVIQPLVFSVPFIQELEKEIQDFC